LELAKGSSESGLVSLQKQACQWLFSFNSSICVACILVPLEIEDACSPAKETISLSDSISQLYL